MMTGPPFSLKQWGRKKLGALSEKDLKAVMRKRGLVVKRDYTPEEMIEVLYDWKLKEKIRADILAKNPKLYEFLEAIHKCDIPLTSYIRLTDCNDRDICKSGSSLDHIVELQVITKFVNSSNPRFCVSIDFIVVMNTSVNLLSIGTEANSVKGKVVKKLLAGRELSKREEDAWAQIKKDMLAVLRKVYAANADNADMRTTCTALRKFIIEL